MPRVALPVPERDAARARLTLPALSANDLPAADLSDAERTDALLTLARVYGADLAWSADPLAQDAAERAKAADDLASIGEQYLVIADLNDWEQCGQQARLSLSAMAASALAAHHRNGGSSAPPDAATILSGRRATEEICMAVVSGVVHVAPDKSAEHVEPFRLHRGPPGGGNRPLVTIPEAVQNAVVAEVQKALNSFRIEPVRFGRG